MDVYFPHQDSPEFILEQIRAPEGGVTYPLPPEIMAILDKVKEKLTF